MNDSAWERLVDTIDVNLGVTRHGRETQPLEDRPDLTQKLEIIEFERAGDTYRLIRATGPAILDRKTHYSHRAGTANRVEYIYDESETAHTVKLQKQAGSEWEDVDISALGL